VAAVFGLLLVLRASQGPPPATSWAELEPGPRASAPALAGPGDQIRVAEPGDSYWEIATELAPGADPRPIVDVLVEVNGGPSIRVGQRLVIPVELIDQQQAQPGETAR
jgi:hypothetical protein